MSTSEEFGDLLQESARRSGLKLMFILAFEHCSDSAARLGFSQSLRRELDRFPFGSAASSELASCSALNDMSVEGPAPDWVRSIDSNDWRRDLRESTSALEIGLRQVRSGRSDILYTLNRSWLAFFADPAESHNPNCYAGTDHIETLLDSSYTDIQNEYHDVLCGVEGNTDLDSTILTRNAGDRGSVTRPCRLW